jgi:probable F420-dependent oxidoreductase
MRFAITYPLVSHPHHPDLVTAGALARVAQVAERSGFDGIGFTDHPAPSQRWLDGGGHDALDPFVALSFCAAATERIRLIPNIVVLPYRNPFVVAKAAATLDVLSGGRFTLAVGSGYLKGEFAAVGVDHGERNELFDEALDAIAAVWTTDDLTLEGRHFSARGVTAHPRPISQPHPPIWIGGNSARARQRVAERGDGWAPFPAPAGLASTARTAALDADGLPAALDDLRARLVAAGREADGVDVCFACHAGGDPASDDFDADEHLAGLADLAAIGVTWVQVGLPGDDVGRVLDTLERYGERVIDRA